MSLVFSLIFRLLCILGLSYTITVFGVTALDLPDIGDSSGSVISPEYERRLGQAFLRQIRQQARIIVDPEIDEYIKSIGYQLASQSDNNTQSFTFFVILDSNINAFAGPGGVIGMNSGVILNSQNESELAAVLAHEISHVTQRHMARAFEEASRYNLPMAAAMIGAILLGTQNPEAGAAALTAITGASLQNQINFTRANEEEADRIGMQLLARANFDPRGMPSFFERLQRNSQYYQGNAPEFLRTHPLTTSRIADSRARAESYERKEYNNSKSYELIRAKLEVISQKSPDDAARLFAGKLENITDNESEETLRYGYAYALILKGNFAAARKQLTYLLSRDEENINYLLAAGKLESAQKNYRVALAIYEEAYNLYPGYRPLVLAYSKTLLDARQPVKARKLLRHYRQNHDYKYDPMFYDLLAQAETQSGNEAEGAIAKAEYFYLIGDTQLAIDKLRFTEHMLRLDDYQEQRVIARRTELEQELELEKKLELR